MCLCFQDAEGFPIDIQITDNGDSTFFCVYIPTKPIKHTIIVTWGEVNVPNSPFRVKTTQTHCQLTRTATSQPAVCCDCNLTTQHSPGVNYDSVIKNDTIQKTGVTSLLGTTFIFIFKKVSSLKTMLSAVCSIETAVLYL